MLSIILVLRLVRNDVSIPHDPILPHRLLRLILSRSHVSNSDDLVFGLGLHLHFVGVLGIFIIGLLLDRLPSQDY